MAKQSNPHGKKPTGKKGKKSKRKKRRLLIVAAELLVLLIALGWIWLNGKMDKLDTDFSFREKDVRVELPEETMDVS